jgi:hypothetical protein
VVHSWRSGGQSVGGSGMGLEESMTGGGLRSLGGGAQTMCQRQRVEGVQLGQWWPTARAAGGWRRQRARGA